jgi:hypothetical protein
MIPNLYFFTLEKIEENPFLFPFCCSTEKKENFYGILVKILCLFCSLFRAFSNSLQAVFLSFIN